MKNFSIVILVFLFPCLITAQISETKKSYYEQALTALAKSDTVKAIDLFKDSGKRENNAEAYYKLAEIYSQTKTHTELTKALQAVRKATEIEKKNIKYRLLMAKTREELFYAHKLNIDERNTAIDDYERILEIDSTCYEALFNLGRLLEENFEEFYLSEEKHAVNMTLSKMEKMKYERYKSTFSREKINQFTNQRSISAPLKFEGEWSDDFTTAEKLFLNAVNCRPGEREPYILLSKLYIFGGIPAKAISILNTLLKSDPHDRDVNLFLGMVYYLSGENENASNAFSTAISLMNNEEKEDITYNSVKKILEPKLGDKINELTKYDMLRTIRRFWDMNDPLNLTQYNERLLEHYTRIAYANLFFQPENKKNIGWKTDRGEILLRYGFPLDRVRYRPQLMNSSRKGFAKTEVWYYRNNVFVFQDIYGVSTYEFATADIAQVPIDTYEFIQDYRRQSIQEYNPSFEGPAFDLTYNTYQFNSRTNNLTDVYLSYVINFNDSTSTPDKFENGYKYGLFYYDQFFNKRFEDKQKVTDIEKIMERKYYIDNIKMSLPSEPGNLAFEIIRNKDKGVASYHGQYKINDFSTKELKLSSLVLASKIDEESICEECIQRNGINIQPNPEQTFSKEKHLYLYYEVYNLTKGKDNLTDFEQKITIQKKEEDNILTDVLDVVGLGSKGEKISTTSNYQTLETDPQIYFQLDLSKYEPGDYVISLGVKDILANSETVSSTNVLLIE